MIALLAFIFFAFSAQAVTFYSENFAGEFKIVGPFGDDPNTYVPIGFSLTWVTILRRGRSFSNCSSPGRPA